MSTKSGEKSIVNKARQWLSSPKGQRALKGSIKAAKEETKNLDKSRQLDPACLRKVYSI